MGATAPGRYPHEVNHVSTLMSILMAILVLVLLLSLLPLWLLALGILLMLILYSYPDTDPLILVGSWLMLLVALVFSRNCCWH